MNGKTLNMWTITHNPRDYPSMYVARRAEITAGHVAMTDDVRTAMTLKDIRALLPYGLIALPRSPEDDPVIVEVWL